MLWQISFILFYFYEQQKKDNNFPISLERLLKIKKNMMHRLKFKVECISDVLLLPPHINAFSFVFYSSENVYIICISPKGFVVSASLSYAQWFCKYSISNEN